MFVPSVRGNPSTCPQDDAITRLRPFSSGSDARCDALRPVAAISYAYGTNVPLLVEIRKHIVSHPATFRRLATLAPDQPRSFSSKRVPGREASPQSHGCLRDDRAARSKPSINLPQSRTAAWMLPHPYMGRTRDPAAPPLNREYKEVGFPVEGSGDVSGSRYRCSSTCLWRS